MNFFFQPIKILLIFSFLASCAAIPGKNIKLESFPNVTNTNDLNLSYKLIKFEPDYKGLDFASKIADKINRKLGRIDKNGKIRTDRNYSNGCLVNISATHYAPLPRTCVVNYFAAGVTLFIIPYYCQHIFEAKAQLISQKDNRVLKEYYLKDKAHEVWSLLMILAAIPIKSLRELPAAPEGNIIVENTIAEALTRQIIHDANQFPECKK